jgi:hypothetical protein
MEQVIQLDLFTEEINQTNKHHIVIKFLHECKFPRFSMEKGATWVLHGSVNEYITCKKKGLSSFPFAGGQCLFSDIEQIYDGYSRFKAYYGAGDYNNMTSDEMKVEKLMCGY